MGSTEGLLDLDSYMRAQQDAGGMGVVSSFTSSSKDPMILRAKSSLYLT